MILEKGLRFFNLLNREIIKDHYESMASRIDGFEGNQQQLGDEVLVKGRVQLSDKSIISHRCTVEGQIKILENTFISPKSVLIGKLKIGKNVFVEAGSIVTKSVPDNSYAFGNPLQIIKGKKFTPILDSAYHEKHDKKEKDLTKEIYRMADIEKSAKIGEQVYIEGGGEIYIGKNSHIGDRVEFLTSHHLFHEKKDILDHEQIWSDISIGNNCHIQPCAIILGGVKIGNNVTVMPGSVVTKDIDDNTVVSGNPGKPNLGKKTGKKFVFTSLANKFSSFGPFFPAISYFNDFENIFIHNNTLINRELLKVGNLKLTIKSGSLVGPRATFITSNPLQKGEIIVNEDCWIGAGATILPGSTIGKGAIIGAGSVVSGNVKENEIWVGNHALKKKNRY